MQAYAYAGQTCNFSQTLHGYDFLIFFLTREPVNHDKLQIPTKQRKIYFLFININKFFINLRKITHGKKIQRLINILFYIICFPVID